MQHLRAKDFRKMPWKNGGGSTSEIAIRPSDSLLSQDFIWRVSLASFAASGPFSRFDGYDRHILQLSGNAMTLIHPEANLSSNLRLLEPYIFPGEYLTEASLEGGPVQDFNLMVNRNAARAKLSSRILSGSTRFALGDAWLAYLWQGSCEIQGFGQLLEGEALVLEDKTGSELEMSSAHAVLIIAEIEIF